MPAERVGQDPSEQDADAAAARGDESEDPHRLRALTGLGEEVHHQRERHSRGDRTPEPLHAAADDERLLRGREAARERRQREEGDADQEEPPVAEEIAEAPSEQQEPAVREQIRVHDPRQRGLRKAEILPDRGQRDADDGHVEDDHQARGAEDVKGEPAGSSVKFGHELLSSRSEP